MSGKAPTPIASYAQAGLMSARDHQALRKSPKVVPFHFQSGPLVALAYMNFPGGLLMTDTLGYPLRRAMRVVEGMFAKANTIAASTFSLRQNGAEVAAHTMAAGAETETAVFNLAYASGSVLQVFHDGPLVGGAYVVLWAQLDEPDPDVYEGR